MFGDPNLFNIGQLKETGMWPMKHLSAYGMLPYLKRMPDGIVGAEVGVSKGENVFAILETIPDIACIYIIGSFGEQKETEKLCRTNLKSFDKKVKFLKTPRNFTNTETFDFILLTETETYDKVKNDLELYYPLLKKDGYMFVQNTNEQHVMEAIVHFRQEKNIRIPLHNSKNFISFWIK